MPSPITVTLRHEEEGGGVREVVGPHGSVNIDGAAILRSFDYTEAAYGVPGVQLHLHIEAGDGRPRCTEVAFRVVDAQAEEVPACVIRDFKLADTLSVACQIATLEHEPDYDRTRKAVETARRRGYTDEMLREVASVYSANIDSFPTRAVREAFGMAQSTAQLYVKKARDKGLITVNAPKGGRP